MSLKFMHDAQIFLESLMAAQQACDMFFQIIDNVEAETVGLGLAQTLKHFGTHA